VSESITGDPEWEKKFSKDAESLGGDTESKAVDSYIYTVREVVRQVSELYPEIGSREKEFITHMVSGYRSEKNPEERVRILERIKFMAQTEQSEEKRKTLEEVIELILRGES
jgi:hypothetical protein